jgi:hypothetical protein
MRTMPSHYIYVLIQPKMCPHATKCVLVLSLLEALMRTMAAVALHLRKRMLTYADVC